MCQFFSESLQDSLVWKLLLCPRGSECKMRSFVPVNKHLLSFDKTLITFPLWDLHHQQANSEMRSALSCSVNTDHTLCFRLFETPAFKQWRISKMLHARARRGRSGMQDGTYLFTEVCGNPLYTNGVHLCTVTENSSIWEEEKATPETAHSRHNYQNEMLQQQRIPDMKLGRTGGQENRKPRESKWK